LSGVELVKIRADDDGIRLDRWFKRHYPALGHGQLEKLLRAGNVRVDGKRATAGLRVAAGAEVRVPPLGEAVEAPKGVAAKPDRKTILADRRAIEDMIIHEDEDVIVLNKPAGLAVQGGTNITQHLDGMMQAYRTDTGEKPRLVHRIDKDTSGILVMAKSAAAAAKLTAAFRTRAARKVYWALVVGKPPIAKGKIDAPIAKESVDDREKVEVTEDGKRAVTLYAVVDHAAHKVSWLALMPLTGRTHQLRVHCALMGKPIVGDGKYGGADAHLQGSISRKLHLHARELTIPHPRGGLLKVTAPLPKHMLESWALFGFDPDDRQDYFAEEDEA
jgi:23S rRNA pseudouridine955/2504/2580 synthase